MATVTFETEETEAVLAGLAHYMSELADEMARPCDRPEVMAELERRWKRARSAREKVYKATGE